MQMIQKIVSNKKTVFIIMFSIVLPLLAGTSFYIIFCPNVFFVKELRKLLCWGMSAPNSWAAQLSVPLQVIRCYFPDYCWAQTFSAIILLIGISDELNIRWCLVGCALLSISTEVIQIFNFVPLTFDYVDIFIQWMGSLVAILKIKIILLNQYKGVQ